LSLIESRVSIDGPSTARLIGAFVLGCAFFAYGFIHRVAPSVMTDELMRDFAVGGSALGSLSAMYFYAYVSLQIPVGMLMDRFGPRRLMSGALLLCAIASVGFASSDSLLLASISRLVIGGSVAFAFVGTLTILTYWFAPARFAMFAGLLQSSGMVGAMLGQAPLRLAVEHYQWQGALWGLAVLALVLAAMAFIVIPRRDSVSALAQAEGGRTDDAGSVWSILHRRHNWLCALAGFGMAAPMLGFAALWAVPWLTTVRGFGATQSAGIASTVFLGWLVAAPIIGWISDRMGRRKPVLLTGSLVSLLAFVAILQWRIESATVMSLLFFVQGAGGCAMVVCFSLMREYNAHQHTSASLGMLNTCVVGSGAIMQPLIGVALDSRWQGGVFEGVRVYSESNYSSAFLWLIAANVVAVVCSAALTETRCRALP
jgi:MFS family permease